MAETDTTGTPTVTTETPTPAPETKPEDETKPAEQTPAAEPAEDPKFSARLASLAKRETAFQARVTQQKADLVKEAEGVRVQIAEVQRLNELREAAKSDPQRALGSTLAFLGIKPDDIRGLLSDKGELSADFRVRQLEAKLAELEAKGLEARKKELQGQQNADLQRFAQRVTDHIEKNAEAYELTHLKKQSPLVLDVISEAYKATGQLIDIDEACKVVEAHLEEEAKQILATKKFSSHVTPKEKDTTPAQTEATNGSSKTLTNDLGSRRPHMELRDEVVAILNGRA
jgi:hypothetical protein